jgi:hypothetical protein
MKFALFTIIILILFASTDARPNSFQTGLITGIMINSFDSDSDIPPPKQSIDNKRYIHKIIDTELIPFTPKYQYKCYEVKIFIPLTTYETFITSAFMGFFIITLITAISNMDEDGQDFMIGYMLATSMRRRRKRW